jgi:AcrR family transcriptional regulator
MTVVDEPARGRGRPRSERADAAILATALRHLRTRGYAELSMEQVAADAGVGKATIYRRYRNKADLASAALAAITVGEFAQAPIPDGTREALIDHLRRFEQGVGRIGMGVTASLLDESADPELLELHRERVVRRGRARAAAVLHRAQERGEIRADADLEAAMQMLIGSLFARRLSGSEDSPWPDAVVDTLLRGLARDVTAGR